jgi:hypothetical protein
VENKDIFPLRLHFVLRRAAVFSSISQQQLGTGIGRAANQMQGYDPIVRRRKVLEQRVRNMEKLVATLLEAADLEKNNPCHGMHWKLKSTMQALAKRKAELTQFCFENPNSLVRSDSRTN